MSSENYKAFETSFLKYTGLTTTFIMLKHVFKALFYTSVQKRRYKN